MKTHFKLLTGISISVFTSSIVLTTPVYARNSADDPVNQASDSQSRDSAPGGLKLAVFCKNIDTIVSKTTGEITKKGGESNSEWQKRAGTIQTKRAEWQAKVTAARAEAAKKRDEAFAKLDTATTTDAQKTAVATYKQKVLDAVATRQAAHDANFDTYFKAVDALLSSQKANTTGDVNAFKTAVTTAIETAKASCASGANADTIKTQLSAALKAARENFKTQRSGDKSSIKSQLQALKSTRDAANKKANDTFKATLAAARTELKTAFPSTSSDSL